MLLIVNWLLMIIGIGIMIDGIVSALLHGGQYHTFWFDVERYLRAAAGLVVFTIGLTIT